MFRLEFFIKLVKAEFKYIAGKGYLKLLLLSLILTLSLLALGLSESFIQHLDKQMDTMFVSFVQIDIDGKHNITLDDIKKKFKETHPPVVSQIDGIISLGKTYSKKQEIIVTSKAGKVEEYLVPISELSELLVKKNDSIKVGEPFNSIVSFIKYFDIEKKYTAYETIQNSVNLEDGTEVFNTQIRMSVYNDPLVKFLKDEYPIKAKEINFKHDGWGCLVSEKFLMSPTKLNYAHSKIPPYITLDIGKVNGIESTKINVPIQGVVPELPFSLDMIVGENLYNTFSDDMFYSDLLTNEASNKVKSDLKYFVLDSASTEEGNVKEYLFSNDFKEQDSDVMKKTGSLMVVSMNDTIEKERIISALAGKEAEGVYRVYNFEDISHSSHSNYEDTKDAFVFKFDPDALKKVSVLNTFLTENYKEKNKELSIDMSIIKTKNNFELFSKISKGLSWALVIFSWISIFLFITNLIISHITKNQKSLGTLKAFGLSNNNIIIVYCTISSFLISLAFIIAYIISTYLIGDKLIFALAKVLEIGEASEITYINWYLLELIILFTFIPLIPIFVKLKGRVSFTPGDLIYGRE